MFFVSKRKCSFCGETGCQGDCLEATETKTLLDGFRIIEEGKKKFPPNCDPLGVTDAKFFATGIAI